MARSNTSNSNLRLNLLPEAWVALVEPDADSPVPLDFREAGDFPELAAVDVMLELPTGYTGADLRMEELLFSGTPSGD